VSKKWVTFWALNDSFFKKNSLQTCRNWPYALVFRFIFSYEITTIWKKKSYAKSIAELTQIKFHRISVILDLLTPWREWIFFFLKKIVWKLSNLFCYINMKNVFPNFCYPRYSLFLVSHWMSDRLHLKFIHKRYTQNEKRYHDHNLLRNGYFNQKKIS
jgi:hypothetical protein